MTTGTDIGAWSPSRPKPLPAGSWTPMLRELADEIDALRREMEQTYEQGIGFQSEHLLAISQKLDVKINEFLHRRLS
ncbi:aspartyl-phosphate phosphatase Spo0E family protein [Paenibacillus albicereus]|uniref:Aspartyl-phosphate phosphatase Spo0E family protein n=1 Tax=Paenibacillus albicereus TaxID=2726185 RepID=A0A6H2GVB1_9BACL|nr:aspartyl-phosphate phosphatase Spo0E family protein [Paenibacillus albicereus]QJC51364.1 aspartyl-phosphate phosphatase Spo0E family protein [Paenibacillus albicereus]